MTAAASPRSGSPTTSSSVAPSTCRGSRRRRRAPTTFCVSSSRQGVSVAARGYRIAVSEFEQPRGYDLDEGCERSTGPGPEQPTGETLPGDSEPTGVEELRK